jgi:hypothetical protein
MREDVRISDVQRCGCAEVRIWEDVIMLDVWNVCLMIRAQKRRGLPRLDISLQ